MVYGGIGCDSITTNYVSTMYAKINHGVAYNNQPGGTYTTINDGYRLAMF